MTADIQSDPTYLDLRALVALHSAPQAASTPWRDIEAKADALLLRHHDLRVACYRAMAQVAQHGEYRLAPALHTLARFLATDGATMTPVRSRARHSALAWLQAALGPRLMAVPEACQDACRQAACELDQAIHLHRLDTLPRFAAALQATPLHRPHPAPAHSAPLPADAAPAPSTTVQAHRVPTPEAPEPLSVPGADNLVALGQVLLSQADRHLAMHPTDLGALRLRRQGLWLHVQSAPPPVGDTTRIAPLPSALHARLVALEKTQSWTKLLHGAEAAMPSHRLVLALQRLSAQALVALGALPQADAIAADTLALVTRLPQLMHAQARDGTPLLDAKTRIWLEGACALVVQPPAPPPAPTQALDEAPAQLLQSVRQASCAEHALLAQVVQAEALAQGSARHLAAPLFRGLGRALARTPGPAWVPHVALRIWAGEARALASAAALRPSAGRIAILLARIGQLDLPAAHALALELNPLGAQP